MLVGIIFMIFSSIIIQKTLMEWIDLSNLRRENNIQKSLTYLQINSRQSVRGSPSLVGRGIANPMSAMTRGFKSLSPRH